MNRHLRPIAVSAILIVVIFGWLASEISKGVLVATDELLTAERTREMVITGEKWLVHFNFEPSFEKPPLQYWLGTLTLERFKNRSAAIRVWSLFYGALTAAALGWLVFLLEPNRPWLIPLSVGVLVACPLFSTQATRGLLDIGLAFFTVLVFAFAELARKQPRWWIAVSLACWIASLQKVPFPFVIWLLILGVRATSRAERQLLRSKWLPISLLLALALMSLWPLLQVVKYKMQVAPLFYEEAVAWPARELGSRPLFDVPLHMLIDGGACGLLALFAPFVIGLGKPDRVSNPAREIALVSIVVLSVVSISNFRESRYVTPIIPCLCLLVAVLLYRLLARRAWIGRTAVAALVIVIGAGLIETKIEIDHVEGKPRNELMYRLLPFLTGRKDVTDEKLIADQLGKIQAPGVKIVLVKSEKAGVDLLWTSFYLFHAELRSRVTNYTPAQIRDRPPAAPLVGVCVKRDFPVVQQLYPNVLTELVRKQFVCWRVPVAANVSEKISDSIGQQSVPADVPKPLPLF
jgi:4-amino-4-deoxy-L-arabinose transferase-like glycosyltransferase